MALPITAPPFLLLMPVCRALHCSLLSGILLFPEHVQFNTVIIEFG